MSDDLTNQKPESDSQKLTLILANIANLQESQLALGTDLRSLRRDIFSVLNHLLLDIQVDQRDLHERLSRLELDNNPPNSQT